MKGKPIILTLLFISLSCIGWSQKSINLLAMPMGDSIILRWSPLDLESWEHGLQKGYQIRRATLDETNRANFSFSKSSQILADTIKVWSEEKWQNNLNQKDEWEMIAAGMIYGDLGMDTEAPTLDPEILEDRNLARNNRFAIAFQAANHSTNAAKKLGWMYVDNDVVPGQAYLYAVQPYPLAAFPNSADIYLVEENKITTLPIPEIYGTEWGDREVSMAWDHYPFQESFVSYNVERSYDDGHTWEMRNRAPVVPGVDLQEAVLTTFVDSLNDNKTQYRYRIIGHSPFGINSYPSATIKGQGKENTGNVTTQLFPPVEIASDQIQLSWASNDADNIKGYHVFHSKDYNGPFSRINSELLSADTNNFVDSDPLSTNFYYVETIDQTGKSHVSLIRMINATDVIPPAKPIKLTCNLDTLNKGIQLDWALNQEADFMGYRIFGSYREGDGYQDIADSLIMDSNFFWPVDPKRNGENIYFKIQGQDNRYNRSDYSAYCKVQLLDESPPQAPLIRKIIDTKNRIVLEWANSPSYDVVNHELWRTAVSENWQLIASYDSVGTINRFSDTLDLLAGKEYQYKVIALDGSGNSSESGIKKARVWQSKMAPAVKEFKVSKEKTSGRTLLSWQYLEPLYLDKIEIYRQNEEGIPGRYLVLSEEEFNKGYQEISEHAGAYYWIETQNQNTIKHAYAVRILLKNGDVTPRTDWKKESTANE
jgi:hypothetical protein